MKHTLHPGAYRRASNVIEEAHLYAGAHWPHHLPYWEAVQIFLRCYRWALTPAQAVWVSEDLGAPPDYIATLYPTVIWPATPNRRLWDWQTPREPLDAHLD